MAQLIKKKYSHIISLGIACQPAIHLRRSGLKKETYPFDWGVTEFDALYAILENDFAHFFDEVSITQDSMITYKVREGNCINTKFHLKNNIYGNNFSHEMVDYEGSLIVRLPESKAKYERRVARFFNTLKLGEPVLFIRHRISKSQAILLTELLDRKFPYLDYMLLAIDDNEEISSDWGLSKVIQARMKTATDLDAENESFTLAWSELFKKVID